MVPDAEALKLMTEVLDAVNVGQYQIKVQRKTKLNLHPVHKKKLTPLGHSSSTTEKF
jgi:histidyl-tRNA synthetase